MDSKHKLPILTRGWVLRGILFLSDIVLINFSYFIAIILRFSDSDSMHSQGFRYLGMFIKFAPWYTIFCIVIFILFRMYSSVWKYVGFNDLKNLAMVSLLTCVVYILGSLFIVGRMPISVYILGALIQFVLIGLPRIAPRYIIEMLGEIRSGRVETKVPMMIVGLGENARIIQSRITRDKANIVNPVCIVDHAYGYKGNTFNGLPVYTGVDAVKECIDKYDIKCAIIANSNMPDDFIDGVRTICKDKGVELRDFVLGTEYRSLDVRLRELLSKSNGKVCVIEKGVEDRHYEDVKAALQSLKDNYVVDSISSRGDELVINVDSRGAASGSVNDDWIRMYREETGEDISFF